MSVATDRAGARFAFEMTEEDDRTFKQFVTRDAKRYLDRGKLKGLPLLCIIFLFAAPLIVFGVNERGAALTLAGQVVFAIGYFSLMIALRMVAPGMQKRLFGETSEANRRFDCAFDNDGIVIKIGARETRMPWSAIGRVENTQSMVLFWYQPTQGYFVPSRVFADDAARNAFAAWATARVTAAKPAPLTPEAT